MKKIYVLVMMITLTMSLLQFSAVKANAADDKVEKAIAWATSIANDDTHGYSQSNRTGPNYDCSSFVSHAFKNGGFNVSGTLTTSNMITYFEKAGFTTYKKGSVSLQRGDILLNPGKHVELYLGNNQCIAAHDDYDGKSGDGNSQEINIRTKDRCSFCRNAEYTYILRYESNIKTSVTYRSHVQTYGWQDFVLDGEVSGTSGEAKRLEAIEIKLVNPEYSGNIEYRTHIQTYGWETTWSKNGEMSGTSGEAKRLEAIEIRLTGTMAEKYDVYYRVHAETYGWLGWAKNGDSAGTVGLAKRLEAIEIVLVRKGESAPGSTANAFIS